MARILSRDRDSLPRTRLTAAFERRVAASLRRLVPPASTLVVACSGGPDSLSTLIAVARVHPGAVVAGHFDHRLRPPAEVRAERAIVERVAAEVGATFAAGRATSVPSDRSEAAAREARYRWLARACRTAGADHCVTGHTLDDQAETVLLRLIRGAGLGAAAGMSEQADWPVPVRGDAPALVRPLLAVTRREVEAYLNALGVEAAHDPSNDAADYARNRIRHQVMPVLRGINPRASRQIAAFADLARDDDAALDGRAAEVLASIVTTRPGGIGLQRSTLLGLPVGLARRIVRLAAARLGRALDRAQVDAVLHAAGARGRTAALGRGLVARRQGPLLVLDGGPGRPPEKVHEHD